jgi:chromosome segregation ATPase
MDSQTYDDKVNIVENKLKELRDQIEKMEKENAELFADLGIGPHELQGILNDRSNYSKEAYDFIQKERKALEDVIEDRIAKSRAKIAREKPHEPVGGHWIFVR